ncbi:MAG: TIM barrel protein [Acidobacteria bacterium]|nr:TIM barrel protein [Acidobacteriota bacterium]
MPSPSRRSFLAAASAAATAHAQAPPPAAAITSSVMLWTLKGSFEERLAIAARAGIQSVEFVREHDKWTGAELDAARRALRSFNLKVDAISSTPNWSSTPISALDPAQRPALLAEVRRQLGFARRLEAPMALFMTGNRIAGRPAEAQWASLAEGCRRAGDLAAEAGITLIVEPLNTKVNHPGYFLETVGEGARLMKEVDHPHVRLLYDLYHEQVQTGDALAPLAAAMPYVKVFHVADAPGRHDPGTGTMNYDALYRAIQKAGYKGHIALEYLPQGDDHAASLIRAADAMRKSLRAAS